MPSLYDILASAFQPTQQPDPYGVLAGALKADPEGASGFADLAGRSREARAAAGAITAPVGALDYMGKTLRGEEDLRDPVTGGFTNEAYGAAGTLAGVGMTGGIGSTVARAPGEAALGARPIRAYHASPYDFERFDIGKIGAGEGAQAEGHGLYLAENPAVMEQYYDQFRSHPAVMEKNRAAAGPPVDPATNLNAWLEQQSAAHTGPAKPTRYEVNIHADPARFLDWDKPFTQQPAPVRRALADLGIPAGDSGQQIYSALATRNAPVNPISGEAMPIIGRDPAGASAVLRDAGIPGIQYLDAGSRIAGGGTMNRVVFDPATIEILRKYGFLGPLIAGAATASMPDTARK